jgi:uncharacterized protein with von Willebrand factor type A (vWA) domain
VFITDGECQCSETFLAKLDIAKSVHGIRIIGVQVGAWGGVESLKAFADSVFRIDTRDGIKGLDVVIQEVK